MLFAAILPFHSTLYRISIDWRQIPRNVQSHDVIWALKLQKRLPKNSDITYASQSGRQTDENHQ